jgi:hypothetical protein
MVVPKEPKSLVTRSTPEPKKGISPDTEMKTMFSDGPDFDNLFNQTSNPSRQNRNYNSGLNENYSVPHNHRRNHNIGNHVIEDERESWSNYNQSQNEVIKPRTPKARVHKPALNVDDTNYEWKRKESKSSIKSRSSRGSMRSRSGSNIFLGNDIDSAWMKWGRARRASYQRKLEVPDNVPVERATTPIKKARQELIAQFVHPDLTDKYISEDDINYIRRHRQRQTQMYHAIEKSKKNQRLLSAHNDIYLSAREWKILSNFWKHKVFRRSRYIALFFVILSIIILCVSVVSKEWIIYNTIEEGKCNHFVSSILLMLVDSNSNFILNVSVYLIFQL